MYGEAGGRCWKCWGVQRGYFWISDSVSMAADASQRKALRYQQTLVGSSTICPSPCRPYPPSLKTFYPSNSDFPLSSTFSFPFPLLSVCPPDSFPAPCCLSLNRSLLVTSYIAPVSLFTLSMLQFSHPQATF